MDPDLEYIAVFRLNWHCDYDSLRWYGDWRTRVSLPHALKMGSRSSWDDDIHVCFNEDRVSAAGGIQNMLSDFYLHLK